MSLEKEGGAVFLSQPDGTTQLVLLTPDQKTLISEAQAMKQALKEGAAEPETYKVRFLYSHTPGLACYSIQDVACAFPWFSLCKYWGRNQFLGHLAVCQRASPKARSKEIATQCLDQLFYIYSPTKHGKLPWGKVIAGDPFVPSLGCPGMQMPQFHAATGAFHSQRPESAAAHSRGR